MIKLIHSADWHLRDMQFGKTSRSKDFTDSVFRLVDIAVEHGVDYILCAGDILNSKRPSSKNIRDLMLLNTKLRDNKINLFVISGNHDKCSPSWISILQEELGGRNQCAIHDVDFKLIHMVGRDGKEYTMYGVPDMAPDDFREKSGEFPKADILMFHGLVKEFASFAAGDKALSVDDFPVDKYKAILLGDIHTHKYITKDGCIIGYPGSTELCSRQESVNKFIGLFTFHDDDTVTVDSVPIKLNKPIIAVDVKTIDEANKLLAEVERLKDQHPTVLVRKDPKFTDLYIRIASKLNTQECIIRVSNLTQSGFRLMNLVNRRRSNPGDRTPVDFVSDYFPKDSDSFALAQALCDQNTKAAPLIEAFIDKRLYEDRGLTNKKFG